MFGRSVRTSQPQGPCAVDPRFRAAVAWSGASPNIDIATGNRATFNGNFASPGVGIGGRSATLYTQLDSVQIAQAISPGSFFTAVVSFTNLATNTSGILCSGKVLWNTSFGFYIGSKTNTNTIEINGGDGSTFPTLSNATGLGDLDGKVRTVAVRFRGTLADVCMGGRLLGTVSIAAAGGWPSGFGIGNYSGGVNNNDPQRRFYLAAVVRDGDPIALSANPWQIFAPDSKALWTPAAVSVTLPTLVQPTSTTSAGAWTATGAGSLHAAINEAIPSGAEYISVNSASTCEFVLAESAHPGTANQTLAYRASSASSSTLTIRLFQSATTIMERTHALTPTDTLYTLELTAPEISLITAGPISVTLTTS